MAIIVLEIVATGFGCQRLEGLVFDTPPRTGGFHHGPHPFLMEGEVGYPTPVGGCAIRLDLGRVEDRDLKVEIGIVQGNIVVPAEPVGDTPFRGPFGLGVGPGIGMAVDPVEHELVVSGLDPDDLAQVKVLQRLDMGTIGGPGILDDNRPEVGVFLPGDPLGSQGNDNVAVQMDKGTTHHLVVVAGGTILVFPDTAGGTRDLAGTVVTGAVKGQQMVSPESREVFQPL